MAQNTVWYFAYASNMSRTQVEQRAGAPGEEKVARLDNYELNFDKVTRGGTGSANIVPADGQTVWGVLYRLSETQLRTLDRFEGVPEHYRRSEVNVTDAEGSKVGAQVYLARKVRKGLKPDRHYLTRIIQGAEAHGLPADYIAQLKKITPA
ncbi:MAG TPA: gamma-glutamylcyclotransferase family protein [Candidatus Acidoferrales bacterium]|nr:gamma-glutamylcyclotransferase family protein [Candidatus Acidoferrales bacterium]